MNPKHELSGPMQMILLFLQLIKNLTQEIAKRSGAGEQNFKMILQHVCNGQQKILMNAIIHLFPCWRTAIILL